MKKGGKWQNKFHKHKLFNSFTKAGYIVQFILNGLADSFDSVELIRETRFSFLSRENVSIKAENLILKF